MQLSLIVAMAANRAIGKDGKIPWQGMLRGEALFKKYTVGKAVVMGRTTWEGLPEKTRPLPLRLNIVLTSHQLHNYDCLAVPSIDEALKATMLETFYDEVVFIGGQSVYETVLPVCDTLYMTELEGIFPGDRFFPYIDISEWEVAQEEYYPLVAEVRPVAYTFKVLKRR